MRGQLAEANLEYQKVLALEPDDAKTRYNLGENLLKTGRLDEAVTQFQKVLALQPGNAEAHDNLGVALVHQKQINLAISQFQQALATRPTFAEARNNLGMALFQQGRLSEAATQFQKALAAQPDFAEAQNSLTRIAWLLATTPDDATRNGTEAVELAGETDGLSGHKNPTAAATLAAAYAETGRFKEAVATIERAIQLASSRGNQSLVSALDGQLKLYQAGIPYRETH